MVTFIVILSILLLIVIILSIFDILKIKYRSLAIAAHFDRVQFIVALLMSSLCLAILVIREVWPNLKLDEISLILIGTAFIPWILMFIKKIKFGDIDIETGKQGKVENPPAPPQPATTKFNSGKDPEDGINVQENITILPGDQDPELSDSARKILATLWRYQKQSFRDDYSKRWTFLLWPHAPGYAAYRDGVEELIKKMLILRQANNQILLTNEGIRFMEQHPEIQGYTDIYIF